MEPRLSIQQPAQRARTRAGPARLLLWLLLSTDAVFVLLHLWAAVERPGWVLFSIAADNGYGEVFQYLKFFWAALLLGWLTPRLGWGCAAWALLFAWLLADDLLALHESLGGRLAEAWDLPAPVGLRAKDLGELLISAAAGAVLLPPIALAWDRGAPAARRLGRDLVVLLLLLVCFGVGLDLLNSALQAEGWLRVALGTLEDGGEMLVASLMLARVFRENASLAGKDTASGES